MSLYSTPDTTKFKPSSVYTNFQKLSKFNKFYLRRNNLSPKINQSNISTKKSSLNTTNLSQLQEHITPIKIPHPKPKLNYRISNFLGTKTHSYKNLTNSISISEKIKNKYDPDILNTQYISKPKKHISKKNNIIIIKYNSFLNNKTKTKSIRSNTFDYKNGTNFRIVSDTYIDKPKINKSIREIQIKNKISYKKNDTMCHSIKILLEKAHKNSKKAASFLTKKFGDRLICDKRENLKEYNKFMNTLKINLYLSKSKFKNIFYYE